MMACHVPPKKGNPIAFKMIQSKSKKRRAFIHRNAPMFRINVKGISPPIIIIYTFKAIQADEKNFCKRIVPGFL